MKLADVEVRLQRIEQKLDVFLERSAKQEADLGWLRAFVKGSIVALVTLTGGLITVLLKLNQ